MRFLSSQVLAGLVAAAAIAWFGGAPAEARTCGSHCSTAKAKVKAVREAGQGAMVRRANRAERRRVAQRDPHWYVWHGWASSFHLDGVRYPGGNPRGPAAWYNNWEGGFHPEVFWVLHARNSH